MHELQDSLNIPVAEAQHVLNEVDTNNDGVLSLEEFKDAMQDPVIGVLRLDYPYQAQLGDVAYHDSFRYKTEQVTVRGLTFQMAQECATLSDEIKDNFIKSLQKLRAIPNIVGMSCPNIVGTDVFVRL